MNGKQNKAIKTAFITGTLSYFFSHIFWPWIVPISTPIVIGFFAQKVQGLSWTETITYALVGFAAVTHGLLRFDEWRERKRVKNKLAFNAVTIGPNMSGPGFVIGIRVVNQAHFPIVFLVTKLTTRLENTVSTTTRNPQRHTIPAMGTGWENDYPVPFPTPQQTQAINGLVEFVIEYGSQGMKLKYRLEGKKSLHVVFRKMAYHERRVGLMQNNIFISRLSDLIDYCS